MAIIVINGVDMPSPSQYSVSLQDIDSENTQRTETGVLQRDRVRGGVYKITVAWQVEHSVLRTITNAISSAKFSVTFFDPTTGSYPTRSMYCGDRDGKLILYKADNPSDSLWELSTSLIEY